MTTWELEEKLTKTIRTRRIILGGAAVLLFALFVASWALWDASEVVTQDPIIFDGIVVHPGFKHVTHEDGYITPLIIGLIGACSAGSFLLSDFLFCRFQTVTKDGQDVTVYRGMLHNIVYVDGKEQGRIGPIMLTNVVEVWLPDGTRATVSFSRTWLYMAHVSFSDHTTSVEI